MQQNNNNSMNKKPEFFYTRDFYVLVKLVQFVSK